MLGWLFRRRQRRTLTGIFMGSGTVYPHSSQPPLMVGAGVARRLNLGDRVEFEVSARTGLARRIRVYRRLER